MDKTPVEHKVCPAPPIVPPGVCVIESIDQTDSALADRWVFNADRLLMHEMVVSDVQSNTMMFLYDEQDRLVRETVCIQYGAGRPKHHPAWREPMVYHDQETTVVTQTEREYGPVSRVPVFGRIRSTTAFEDRSLSDEMRLCYRLDDRQRRLSRYQIYRMSHRPEALDTMVRRYERKGDQLLRIVSETRNFDLHQSSSPDAVPSYLVRHQGLWQADFPHDADNRLVTIESSGSKTHLTYDDHGRLVRWGSFAFAWDEHDRLITMRQGRASFDRTYLYDTNGRFTGARYDDESGYRLVYGDDCPPDFTHPAITPNVNNFLHYEGKDTL